MTNLRGPLPTECARSLQLSIDERAIEGALDPFLQQTAVVADAAITERFEFENAELAEALQLVNTRNRSAEHPGNFLDAADRRQHLADLQRAREDVARSLVLLRLYRMRLADVIARVLR
jgi:hypothetical protein